MQKITLANLNEFPIWELVTYITMIYVGLRGLFTTSGMVVLALGSAAPFYYLMLAIIPVVAIIALFTKPPNGLFLMISCMLLVFTMTTGVYAGLVFAYEGNFIFQGASTLIIFMVGSLLRIIQCFIHLANLQKIVTELKGVTNGNGADSSISSRVTSS